MFLNSSLVELQFLPQLKPIEISHSNMVGAEEEQQLKTGASDSSSSWSLGQLTLLRTKKDGSKQDLLTSVLVNSFKGRASVYVHIFRIVEFIPQFVGS